jgi:pre-rRNA-processing protein TSR3
MEGTPDSSCEPRDVETRADGSRVWVLRDPKESWKRCSLAPLRGREDVRFVTFRPELELDVTGRVLLDPHAPVLSASDVGRPLFLIDSSWRRLPVLRRAVVGDFEARSLPPLPTAYPRKSSTFEDPEQGLASIEALYAAQWYLGQAKPEWLEGYHFREAFLELNPHLAGPAPRPTSGEADPR